MMMSEAAVTHCLATYFNALGQQTLIFIDVGLTSSIALSFLFIALVDAGVFDEPVRVVARVFTRPPKRSRWARTCSTWE